MQMLSKNYSTTEYRAWRRMRWVGKLRGIAITEEWRNSFDAFVADMGQRPSARHLFERIDHEEPYGPTNCRWTIERRSQMPEYSLWSNMIRRCTKPKSPDYTRYGGRGITVCHRWRNSFHKFISDVGRRPTNQHSLDRINNDRGYEPGNVRWATIIEQANNMRSNHLVIYLDHKMTIAEATRAGNAGITRETARCRIKNGWSVKDAVETPFLFRRDAQRRKILTSAE